LSRFAPDHQRAGACYRAGQGPVEEKAHRWRCKTHDETGPKNSALSAAGASSDAGWCRVSRRRAQPMWLLRRIFLVNEERGFMGKQIRIGIVGYGNLGRGVEAAIAKNPDMTLAGIFTRRAPADLKPLFAQTPVHAMASLEEFQQTIDVLIDRKSVV